MKLYFATENSKTGAINMSPINTQKSSIDMHTFN